MNRSVAMGKTGAGPGFPLACVSLIFGLSAFLGLETGYAFNLARDLSPGLISYTVGHGYQTWSGGRFTLEVSLSRNVCSYKGYLDIGCRTRSGGG